VRRKAPNTAKAPQVSPAAVMGETHASNGWPGRVALEFTRRTPTRGRANLASGCLEVPTATLGLREARITTRTVGKRPQGRPRAQRGVRREAPNTAQRNGFTAAREMSSRSGPLTRRQPIRCSWDARPLVGTRHLIEVQIFRSSAPPSAPSTCLPPRLSNSSSTRNTRRPR